jgi:hypothetical protein
MTRSEAYATPSKSLTPLFERQVSFAFYATLPGPEPGKVTNEISLYGGIFAKYRIYYHSQFDGLLPLRIYPAHPIQYSRLICF